MGQTSRSGLSATRKSANYTLAQMPKGFGVDTSFRIVDTTGAAVETGVLAMEVGVAVEMRIGAHTRSCKKNPGEQEAQARVPFTAHSVPIAGTPARVATVRVRVTTVTRNISGNGVCVLLGLGFIRRHKITHPPCRRRIVSRRHTPHSERFGVGRCGR